eukprot:271224-Hanusia_phi.AAC.2
MRDAVEDAGPLNALAPLSVAAAAMAVRIVGSMALDVTEGDEELPVVRCPSAFISCIDEAGCIFAIEKDVSLLT